MTDISFEAVDVDIIQSCPGQRKRLHLIIMGCVPEPR
jgi:hypothetical protein